MELSSKEEKIEEKEYKVEKDGVTYVNYSSETQLPRIIELMSIDLSEPYSVFTYRHFMNTWPDLSIIVI